MYRTLTIARHAQTGHNKNKILQGRLETELSLLGVDQSVALCRRLLVENFDSIYLSTQLRTHQTLEWYLDRMDEQNIILSDEIVERDYGKYAGLSGKVLKQQTGLKGDEFHERLQKQRCVESNKQLDKRTSLFVKEYMNSQYTNTLVMTHGGTIRSLRRVLLHDPSPVPVSNTGVFKYIHDMATWKEILCNDTSHLD